MGDLSKRYPSEFCADQAYRATLPDVHADAVPIAAAGIDTSTVSQQIGTSNVRLPMRVQSKTGAAMVVDAAVSTRVDLPTTKRGIDMSRLVRGLYQQHNELLSFAVLQALVATYQHILGTTHVEIAVDFSYPLSVRSLRSNLPAFQYYDVGMHMRQNTQNTRILKVGYVYSSTCPCSLALAEHARKVRKQMATAHAQRSKATIEVVVKDNDLCFEDVITMCRQAIPTETQVIAKREDEQAFAELNSAHPLFAEDAARALSVVLLGDARVGDFRISVQHAESLHNYDAVAVVRRGDTFC